MLVTCSHGSHKASPVEAGALYRCGLDMLRNGFGERRLTELELPWLPGYQGAAPVRIGNAASNQYQLDVYGEIMDAFHQGRRGGL